MVNSEGASEAMTLWIDQDRHQTLQALTKQVRSLELAGRRGESGRISSGCVEIDGCLPGGGYSPGSLVEFLSDGAGNGGQWLAFQAAKGAIEGGKYLLVVDPYRRFYPWGSLGLGLPLERMIVVHPHSSSDVLWAIDQGLRSTAIGAVVSSLDRLEDRDARRLQLAAEQGGSLGLLSRPSRLARGLPSWAEVQWHVAAQRWKLGTTEDRVNCRRMELQLLRCRGGTPGARLKLILDGERGGVVRCEEVREVSKAEGIRYASQGAVCLAAELAMPTHVARGSVVDRAPLRAAGA